MCASESRTVLLDRAASSHTLHECSPLFYPLSGFRALCHHGARSKNKKRMHWNPTTGRAQANGVMPLAMFRPFAGVATSRPLPEGDEGVAQTIATMNQLVDDAVKDPAVNRYAVDIVRNIPAFQPDADILRAQAIYQNVMENFAYVQDPIGPLGPKETLRPVRELLDLKAGDCDDLSMLIAALCGTVGYETRFITVAADPEHSSQFSHIYPEVLASGKWIAMDCARPGAHFGAQPQGAFRVQIWPVPARVNPLSRLNGLGRLQRYGRMGNMGDGSTFAQDVQASGTAAADIIAATNPNSVYYRNAANPSLVTPGSSPYAASPLLPSSGINIGGTTNTTTLLLFGGLALLLVLMVKK
jgi:hypothetical protein